FSSCVKGFKPRYDEGSPAFVSLPVGGFPTAVPDLAGLDRQPFGQYAIAADVSDPTSQRILLTYVNEVASGSDDVHVVESLNRRPADGISRATSSPTQPRRAVAFTRPFAPPRAGRS